MTGKPMKTLVAAAALAFIGSAALAQDRGPAPQSGMEKPGMTDGAKQSGAMDTTGAATAKGGAKQSNSPAPATKKKDEPHK